MHVRLYSRTLLAVQRLRDGDAQISVSKLIRQGGNKSDEDGRREKKGIGYTETENRKRRREGQRDIAESYERITARRRGVEHVYALDLRTPDSP
ncbi:unnamed protein product [Lasius platythorax]|uniref:Uncharacterized protein n=1 Tax=Lasius platythorax TaxID=488582 RepID=A0AAV2NEH1_9HYME